MKIKNITQFLENLAPRSSQESYDNSGLLIGDSNADVTGILVCLDSIEAIVDEAIEKGCNLIVAHHPIIFKGLKRLTGKTYVERVVQKCIKNDIALYAIHTNYDNYRHGVNEEIADRLGLKDLRILAPKSDVLNKLVVYAPHESAVHLLQAMFEAGAGKIGNYSECSFSMDGIGTFRPNEDANPYEGENGFRSTVEEKRIEVLVSRHRIPQVLEAMREEHPYEEVAYELIPLANVNQDEGSGMIGTLSKELKAEDFLTLLKEKFNCKIIRHTSLLNKSIQKVAVCGGSGSFLLPAAISQNADIFITADFKYHDFFDAESHIIIADIGHYESEQFTINRLADHIKKNFPKFAVHLTGVNTNPINYF